MGNMMERNEYCTEEAESADFEATAAAVQQTEEVQQPPISNNNISYQLFSYRQQIGLKKHQLLKWATSKLLLTEELLKLRENQQVLQQKNQNVSWDMYEEALLTDDEEDVLLLRDDPLANELSNLKNYRLELRSTILEIAQDRVKKREKKKLKRLKRRTLISSKKPSKKNKSQQHSWLNLDQEQQRPDVILID